MMNSKDIHDIEEQKRFLICNGNSYNIKNYNGLDLVENLQEIARENGISKFDIYDSQNKNLSPADIESGDFSGNLSLKIEKIL